MNDSPHIIRLRDPWDRVPRTEGDLELVRRFGRPTGLTTDDRVDLVIVPHGNELTVRLNGQPLGEVPATGSPWHVDVTTQLVMRNELAIAGLVEHQPPPIVRLEIFASST